MDHGNDILFVGKWRPWNVSLLGNMVHMCTHTEFQRREQHFGTLQQHALLSSHPQTAKIWLCWGIKVNYDESMMHKK